MFYRYVIANHVVRLGHFNSAGMLYDNMLRFFTQNHKDVRVLKLLFMMHSYFTSKFINIL